MLKIADRRLYHKSLGRFVRKTRQKELTVGVYHSRSENRANVITICNRNRSVIKNP